MENQKAKLQNRKKQEAKYMGKQRNVKKGEKMGKKWTCPFAFLLLFRFAFLLLFFCFFSWKKGKIKANTKQVEKAKKNNKNANGQVHFFPIFSPFCLSFFPLLFCFCVFLDFADLLFCFSIFFAFFALFFKFKKNKN